MHVDIFRSNFRVGVGGRGPFRVGVGGKIPDSCRSKTPDSFRNVTFLATFVRALTLHKLAVLALDPTELSMLEPLAFKTGRFVRALAPHKLAVLFLEATVAFDATVLALEAIESMLEVKFASMGLLKVGRRLRGLSERILVNESPEAVREPEESLPLASRLEFHEDFRSDRLLAFCRSLGLLSLCTLLYRRILPNRPFSAAVTSDFASNGASSTTLMFSCVVVGVRISKRLAKSARTSRAPALFELTESTTCEQFEFCDDTSTSAKSGDTR